MLKDNCPGGTVRVVAFNDLDLDAVRAQLEARRNRDRQRLGVLAERPELGSKRESIGSQRPSFLRGRTERAPTKLDEGT
jgi:hypothetical protein